MMHWEAERYFIIFNTGILEANICNHHHMKI